MSVLVSFVGKCLTKAEVITVLTAVHMTSMSSNIVERNDLLASATVDLRSSKSFDFFLSFFHKMVFLRVGLARYGWCGVSNNTMSWSLFGPIGERGLHLILKPGYRFLIFVTFLTFISFWNL